MRFIRSWLKCERAAVFIEFAAIAPFMILLVLGGAELTRYATILMRLDKATYDMANIIAQEIPATNPPTVNEISVARVQNAMNNFSALMSPFDDRARQGVMVTSVQRVGGTNFVRWRTGGGGTLGVGSIVNGAIGGGANFGGVRAGDINAQLGTMLPNENMLVIETVYQFQPFLRPVLQTLGLNIGQETFRREHFFAPRFGLLEHLPPLVPVPPPPLP